MRWLRSGLARLIGFLSRDRAHDDIQEELQAHVELETAELVRRGLPPALARRRALIASGGLAEAAEAVRDQRTLPLLETLVADLRYAFRSLWHSPGFTVLVVITLALGIGANTAIFSVVRGVLLKPLPHRDGDRLVYLRQSADGPGAANLTFSVPEVRDLRNGVTSLAGIAEFSTWGVVHQTEEGAWGIGAGLVTGNYFEVMGLSPILGRVTEPRDDGPGAAPVAVLAHEYWLQRFGGDSGVVGRIMVLNRQPVTVIGVLQPAPFFPEREDVLLNLVNSTHHLGAAMQEGRTHRMTEVVARLRPGTSLEQVKAEVATVYGRLQRADPDAYPAGSGYRVTVIPFKTVMGERARLTLILLMASAAFVLIVSAANVANLTLIRGIRREHELVVRAALGAGAARLRRLVLAENLALAALGAVLGAGLAMAGTPVLVALAARYSTRASEIRLDGVVLGFTVIVALVVALVLSYLAALPREGGIAERIQAGKERTGGNRNGWRIQRSLVVVQVAVTVILLAGAGLLTRTLIHLANVSSGLANENVLTMQVTLLTWNEMRDANAVAAARQQVERIRQEIGGLPGVVGVGMGGTLPLRSSGYYNLLQAEGGPLARPGEAMPRVEFRTADPEFFQAAGIPILRGRSFTTAEEWRPVVIVNQVLADQLFPGVDPVGRRLAWKADWMPDSLHWTTIVGVAGSTRDGGLDHEPRSVVYAPMGHMAGNSAGLVIRTKGRADGVIGAATHVVRRVAPLALIDEVMTIPQYREKNVSPQRLNALLISLFGLLAVILAAVGVAGVVAFSVSVRTRELGIRMSLGADAGAIRSIVLREGGGLVAVGLVLGLVGAELSAGVIRGLLFGVAPGDPVTFAGVVLIMVGIGLLACWIPAARAARIDPAVSMRA
jgi:predicted permease